MPPPMHDEDMLDYGNNEYEDELANARSDLLKEQELSRSLRAQLDAFKDRHGDARMLDVSDSDDQWAHVQDARTYVAPAASEASLPSLASDLEYITKAEHDNALADTKRQLELLHIRRHQSQVDAKEMQKQNESLHAALMNRGEELAAFKAQCKDLRGLLEDPQGKRILSERNSAKLAQFYNEDLGSLNPMRHPVLDEVPSFASHSAGQFMSNEAKRICGVFAMFSTREQTMFFPETHAARAVIVRSTHKFIKKDDSGSGYWERFENRTDFQEGNVRQVFWRTGYSEYKYMGAYRCVFRNEMSLGQVPKFSGFDPHNIIRNAVKQHEFVSPLITSSVESLFNTSAIRVNCWALERIAYSEKLEDALFLPAIAATSSSLPPLIPYPSSSHAYQPRRGSSGSASARAPAPYTKRPRGDDSRRSQTSEDDGRSYKYNRHY